MNAPIGKRACRNCSAVSHEGADFYCRFNPPAAQAVIIIKDGKPVIAGQVTVWPKVEPDWSCRQHAAVALYDARDMPKGRVTSHLAGIP